MLVADIAPLASAYNALLAAAIHIPHERSQIVNKALDIYTDMMKRKVLPDSDTYNILVGLIAARCLEVSSLKVALEGKRQRFGGMDEPGKFMLASDELDHAILSADDRLDLALKLFDSFVIDASTIEGYTCRYGCDQQFYECWFVGCKDPSSDGQESSYQNGGISCIS